MENMAPSKLVVALSLSSCVLFMSVSLEAMKLNSNTSNHCIQIEKRALLDFKDGLEDPSGRLSSWVGEDCCKWKGVSCSNMTGNVIKLDLRNPLKSIMEIYSDAKAYEFSCLGGEINPSVVKLRHLHYLDLSQNNFRGIQIPNFFGSFKKLKYLNLSLAFFAGIVPPHLGNLSNLQHLDVSAFPYSNQYPERMWVSDLNWLSGLSNLMFLNLGCINLSSASSTWFQAVNMLPSLEELHLPDTDLRNLPQSLPSVNLTSLQLLMLDGNHFNSPFPHWLYNITTLVHLFIGSAELTGTIQSNGWKNLCRLRTLFLYDNRISSEITELVGCLTKCADSNLEMIDLGSNNLRGRIPESMGQLTSLSYLDLTRNSWEGNISEIHFLKLKNLKDLSLSTENKSLTFDVRDQWTPSFGLQYIFISGFHLGPDFPPWLQTQKELVQLTLADASLEAAIPDWIWKLSSQLNWLLISGNQLSGTLPKTVRFSPGARVFVDLSSNKLQGPLPLWPDVEFLKLSNNSFSGPIPENIGQEMSSVKELDLSTNSINGEIPSSLSKLKRLSVLDLSNNRLSGEIPKDLRGLEELQTVDLSRNNLSGGIPSTLCIALPQLSLLKLSSNNLSGELSESLRGCKSLNTLDLGDNKFNGTIPDWIGQSLLRLSVLNLRRNMFNGDIPQDLCHLQYLHILDLAGNNLLGPIPSCLGNLSSFSSFTPYDPLPPGAIPSYSNEMEFYVKGRLLEYTKILDIVNIIDLSGNRLQGEIPEGIANLSYLGGLNLSRNHLAGRIPDRIGELKWLESLDLSWNHLSGPIPASMASMTFLNFLNLSYNNLTGVIPSANQFATLNDLSIYKGNLELCGSPLPKSCSAPNQESEGNENHEHKDDEDDGTEMKWMYWGMAAGFAVGFWTVCGALVAKKSWRCAYFQFMGRIGDRIYVMVVVNMNHLQRKLWER